MNKPIGRFALVLHGHLPYVLAHGRWPHGLDMLCECAAESYLPLLEVFNRLVSEGFSPKVTLGITPILAEQLADDDFKGEFLHYLDAKIETAKQDEEKFNQEGNASFAGLARRWQEHYAKLITIFTNTYQQDIISAFKKLQDDGHIEIITSMATHAYSPLIGYDISLQAQVKQAVSSYKRHFGQSPRGFWMPECGYRPGYEWRSPLNDAGPQTPTLRKGVEEFLGEAGLDYFFVDEPLLAGGEAIGVYLERFDALQNLWEQFQNQYTPPEKIGDRSPYRPYLVKSAKGKKPVAVFARDPRSGMQVWSGDWGYPGDPWYLDFHKKHVPGGMRYWRVTSSQTSMEFKERYEPERIEERLKENAAHFKELVKGLLTEYSTEHKEAGVICSPYDMELFGHWWFEGPEWLYYVLRWMNEDPEMQPATCSEALAEYKPDVMVSLPEGSWGQGGFHWIWLNEWTDWIWKEVYAAEEEMQALALEFADSTDENLQKILRQAARELLLLEASDWQFLISTWSARDYADLRAELHFGWFRRLAHMARTYGRGEYMNPEEWTFLGECEKRDSIFPDADPKWWAKLDYPAE